MQTVSDVDLTRHTFTTYSTSKLDVASPLLINTTWILLGNALALCKHIYIYTIQLTSHVIFSWQRILDDLLLLISAQLCY
jgi:hypothetical protein